MISFAATHNDKAVTVTWLARTLDNLKTAWRDIADNGDSLPVGPILDSKAESDLTIRMQECIEGKGGEVSARVRAARLGEIYLNLNGDGRLRFLEIMATRFGHDLDSIDAAVDHYRSADDDGRLPAIAALDAALQPPNIQLLTQFNALPQGVKFLVDMRDDLLRHRKNSNELMALDVTLEKLLGSWFDIGFLEMQRITWNSPASLLEKLVEYEAVHEIRSWTDLRNRLDSDRRLFAFFHPRMPTEPLIFVEVALVNGIAGSIQNLLDEEAPALDPSEADTAIFYSISNTQTGLRGVSFGNFLIKRVAETLTTELPNLKTFCTLSPIPGFRSWLKQAASENGEELLTPEDRKRFKKHDLSVSDLLSDDSWKSDPDREAMAKAFLQRVCAVYFLKIKKDGLPVDPVARFHLSNGAQIERLNWMGDTSAKGLKQSCGLMVNYLYKLSDIERNHERFAQNGHVTTSSAVKGLL